MMRAHPECEINFLEEEFGGTSWILRPISMKFMMGDKDRVDGMDEAEATITTDVELDH